MLIKMDDEGKGFVIAYVGQSNNNANALCNLYKDKCLVAVWAIAHFYYYLYRNDFFW